MRACDILVLAGASIAASLGTHGPGQMDGVRLVTGALNNTLLTRSMNVDTARCGPGFGKCSDGNCCSVAGYCGSTAAHCRSPDCLIDFGRCDASKRPQGPPTSDIPRTHIGKAAYGPDIIRSCTVPGTVALTYDDGPGLYTEELLDLLDRYNAKVTFFITGINNAKGPIDDPDLPWESLIHRMHNSGHQIASHTWSHQDLSVVSHEQLREQMFKNEAAFRNIMGSFPTYMRPPYSRCGPENGCLQELGALGYHVVLFDIDTKDYSHDSPERIQISKETFDNALDGAKASDKSWLVISHDVHEQTVRNLTEHMLKRLLKDGYRPVTVGECLDDSKEFWYRKDSHGPPHHGYKKEQSKAKKISRDGTCGMDFTCTGSNFGICCGAMNSCGNSTIHCGLGCQAEAGHCAQNYTHVDNHTAPFDSPLDSERAPRLDDDTPTPEGEHHWTTPKKSRASSVFQVGVGSSLAGLMVVLTAMALFL